LAHRCLHKLKALVNKIKKTNFYCNYTIILKFLSIYLEDLNAQSEEVT